MLRKKDKKIKKYSRKNILEWIEKLLQHTNYYSNSEWIGENNKLNVSREQLKIINYIFASNYLKVIVPIKINANNNWNHESNIKDNYVYINSPYQSDILNKNYIILRINAIGLTDKGYDYIHKYKTFFKNYISVILSVVSLLLSIMTIVFKLLLVN
ncbi:hypothetical protein [Spiroplasma endosymbiont of Villa modesta]|uniref:hypothetical protein n=1 Tax=Spiroplasma endosymbiont of Villa modesta TaxID=3066293 RepID=UPI00313BCACD